MNILLTGATGYVGQRLAARLLEEPEVRLRLLVRNKRKLLAHFLARAETIEGDTFQPAALRAALDGVDVAYYLIHSMGAGDDFEKLDRRSAENFRDACVAAGVRRMVYLGGLGVKGTASPHLLSRIETGEILSARADRIQTIWFRAGVIIGSGSASFEIMRNLVQKLPVMVTPRWVRTRTQPIAVGDVVNYLVRAARVECVGDLVVDIGSEPMSFRDMILRTAEVMGLRRFLIPVPVLSPTLSSYWLVLFTPVPYRIAASLIAGLKSETLVQNANALRYFPEVRPKGFEVSVQRAIGEIEQNQVLSRWCDSSGGTACDVPFQDDMGKAVFTDVRRVDCGATPPSEVFSAVLSLGGEAGWSRYNLLWEIRGLIDKLAGGYGLSRGRRHPTELRVGDGLDFWKVVDVQKDRRLLLLAQMKLPGKAWLEFLIDGSTLIQTAYFYPNGLWGRLYWYLVFPFHALVFGDLARSIASRASRPGGVSPR